MLADSDTDGISYTERSTTNRRLRIISTLSHRQVVASATQKRGPKGPWARS